MAQVFTESRWRALREDAIARRREILAARESAAQQQSDEEGAGPVMIHAKLAAWGAMDRAEDALAGMLRSLGMRPTFIL